MRFKKMESLKEREKRGLVFNIYEYGSCPLFTINEACTFEF